MNDPGSSSGNSRASRATGIEGHPRRRIAYRKSSRIKKGETERPYLTERDSRHIWNTIIPCAGFAIGLFVCIFLIYDGLKSIPKYKYCPVLVEDFSSGFNDTLWTREIELGGFHYGQFQQTTNSSENAFVLNGTLYIRPTLQDRALIMKDHVLNLSGNGCTGSTWADCVALTNTTNGTIINPVRSGRINTKHSASIKYGRIEVVAKLPVGDWLWPSIRLVPSDNKYGKFPRSGEIVVMESRGNNHDYPRGGNNVINSALHFGPDEDNDGWLHTSAGRRALHTSYADGYNTYGIEWSNGYIFTYVNTRLLHVLYKEFKMSFWQRGRFPLADRKGRFLVNPWAHTGSNVSPFDQDFYLAIDIGVGGKTGWFEDGRAGKPWVDTSPTAMRDFWRAQDEWYSTWQKQGWMEIKSVKIWQQEGYGGCEKGER